MEHISTKTMRPTEIIKQKKVEEKKIERENLEKANTNRKKKSYELESQKHLSDAELDDLDIKPVEEAILQQQEEILRKQAIILSELGIQT